jgi:hypothetical protein
MRSRNAANDKPYSTNKNKDIEEILVSVAKVLPTVAYRQGMNFIVS